MSLVLRGDLACTKMAPENGISACAASPDLHGRMAPLDGLRGFAVLGVLLCHFSLGATLPTRYGPTIVNLFLVGDRSVELFFVLSGFLITGILYDAKNSGRYFRNFYMRRVLRIFPLYYGSLLLTLGIPHVLPALIPVPEAQTHAAWYWLYAENFYCAKVEWFGQMSQFWTLAIEEHFYFLWPLVIFFTTRRGGMIASLAFIVGSLAARAVVFERYGNTFMPAWTLTPCRLDELAAGSFLALFMRGPNVDFHFLNRLAPVVFFVALATMGALFVRRSHQDLTQKDFVSTVIGVTITGTVAAALLVWALTAAKDTLISRIFSSQLLGFFGAYSYGIYIWHDIVIPVYFDRYFTAAGLSQQLGSPWLGLAARLLILTLISTLIAVISWHLYEKQFLKLKHFFEPAKKLPTA